MDGARQGEAMAIAQQTDPVASRHHMIEAQIMARGVKDPRVLRALRQVPLGAFVAAELEEFADRDSPLPSSEGQTTPQPDIVALMIEAAGVGPGSHVLDVRTGSGYAAAVLSRIAAKVYTIERHQALADA